MHTDSRLSRNAYGTVVKRYMYIVRSTSRCHSVSAANKFFTDEEALAASLALPWASLITLARLRYLARALISAPEVLFALLEDGARHPDSWNAIARRDCQWLFDRVGKLYGFPPPESNFDDLIDWIATIYTSWQSAVRLAKKD